MITISYYNMYNDYRPITIASYHDYLERREVYRNWFNTLCINPLERFVKNILREEGKYG